MKQIIPIIIIMSLVFLVGCQVNTETKYQCTNGKIVDSLNLCSTQICPELDCSKCPKQVETKTKEVIKYQCYDGTIKDNIKDCDIIEVNPKEETMGDIDYKFSDYNDYQDFVKEELEDLIEMEDIGNYGGQESKSNGSVYFLYYKKGEWDFYYYWAVEVDAETSKLIKYKDITSSDGSRDRFNEVWWIPEK